MTTWTYAGADANDVQYGKNRWQHFSIWLSPVAVSPAPLLISLPGGGWLPAPFQLYSRENPNYPLFGGSTAIEQAAIDNGMHVVRAMYPNAGSSLTLQIQPATVFPDNLIAVAQLVQFLKDHADSWGIDPARICLKGSSAGGHLGLLSQMIPLDIGLARFQPGFPLANDPWAYTSSCRVRAVVNDGGPLDFGVIDPTTAGAAAKALFYAGERYPNFKSLPASTLKAASPYWWAQRNPNDVRSVAVFTNFTGSPSVDPDSWDWGEQKPGFVGVDDAAYGKRWETWHGANIPASSNWATFWGLSTPPFPNTSGNTGLSGTAFASALVSWWQTIGLI
jgi:hypothetical protein